jgi:hypothetical protein
VGLTASSGVNKQQGGGQGRRLKIQQRRPEARAVKSYQVQPLLTMTGKDLSLRANRQIIFKAQSTELPTGTPCFVASTIYNEVS